MFLFFSGQIWGVRHTQALLLFCCTSIAYSLRVILSVAIVAMVDHESKTAFKASRLRYFSDFCLCALIFCYAIADGAHSENFHKIIF